MESFREPCLTTGGLPVKGYASICTRSSETFRPSNLWKPFNTPNGLFGFGVSSNTCFSVDRPNLDLSVKRTVLICQFTASK